MVKQTAAAIGAFSAALLLAAPLPAVPRGDGARPPAEAKAAAPAPLAPERVELVPRRESRPPEVPASLPAAVATAGEADPREAFARANSLYEAGDYQAAADVYGTLVTRGYRGGNLFYNLGNANLKLDRKGAAILCYRKALLLLPRDQDLKSNLDYALSLVEDRLEPAPRSWPARRWETAVGWFTLREWRLAAALLLWLLCASLAALIYAPAARPALSRVSAALAIFLLAAAAAAFSRARLEGREQAVILAPEAKVRYGPSEKDVVAFVIHEGALVEIGDERGDWCQVSLPDGKAGWVRKEQYGRVR